MGILLTDGATALLAIRKTGGTAMIQEPAESMFPQMPLDALQHGILNYQLPLNKICLRLADGRERDAAIMRRLLNGAEPLE